MRTRLSRAVHKNGGVARVVIEHLSKVFTGPRGESIHAVVDASLSVEDKEFVVLVGPSGCGKTTTLRLIAGLEEASSGVISIDGKVVNDLAPRDRDIAMVFQNYALYPHMSVYENMAFGLKVRNHPRAEINKRVKEAAEILDLLPCLDRKPSALSGGQRQRVAVGRAIVRQPKVFLFDEPLSNLDANLRAQMRAEISRLHTRLAATMIYVTHDQAEAMTLGQRIVVMKQGVIPQVADPLDLYHCPANRFVAGFIGSRPMNFFHGALARKGNELFFEEQPAAEAGGRRAEAGGRPPASSLQPPAFSVRVDESMALRLNDYLGRAVVFGIRPENIAWLSVERGASERQSVEPSLSRSTLPRSHAQAGDALSDQKVEAVVQAIEALGADTYLHLASGAHSFVARTCGTNRVSANHKLSLVFDMASVYIVAPTTEK